MCVSTVVTGTLPASKTHRTRRWAFAASADLSRPGVGTLTIAQGTRDVTDYLIDLEAVGTAGRHQVFFASQDETGDVYAVTCSPVGVPEACTCTGFARHGGCKHHAACDALIRRDVLPLRNVLPEVLVEPRCELCREFMGGEAGRVHFRCACEQQHYVSHSSADLQGGF